jgi:hypothetical protein
LSSPRLLARSAKTQAGAGRQDFSEGYHRTVKAIGWTLTAVSLPYIVLYYDFGEHEHVFSSLRDWFHRTVPVLGVPGPPPGGRVPLEVNGVELVRRMTEEKKKFVEKKVAERDQPRKE